MLQQPNPNAQRVGIDLRTEEEIEVSDMFSYSQQKGQVINFLKLADGSGWVYNQDPETGDEVAVMLDKDGEL